MAFVERHKLKGQPKAVVKNAKVRALLLDPFEVAWTQPFSSYSRPCALCISPAILYAKQTERRQHAANCTTHRLRPRRSRSCTRPTPRCT
jgi:hypothetical protein